MHQATARFALAVGCIMGLITFGSWSRPAGVVASVTFPQGRPSASSPHSFIPLVARDFSPPAPPAWLDYLNSYRDTAELAPLLEMANWSDGCWKHSRYMVKNGVVSHYESLGNTWYSPEGALAAWYSNLVGNPTYGLSDEWAIDVFMQAPFHAVSIIDPQLRATGFGSYREAVGSVRTAVALDVLRGSASLPPGFSFPVMWPGDGESVALHQYVGYETPDPLTSCPGYAAPSGLPIILQIGAGSVTPAVTAHTFKQGNASLESCVFDETNYKNSDSGLQQLGRDILNMRDAIVLVPRLPLTPGATYTASITANGRTYTWSFTVSATVHDVSTVAGPAALPAP